MTNAQPAAVPPGLYSEQLLQTFAAGEHEAFLKAGGRPLRPRLARSLALADLKPGLDVVDIGCGRGEASAHAARRGCNVIALDYSPGSLSLAGQTAQTIAQDCEQRGHDMQPVFLAASDATALPLPDECADRVLLLDVIEHLHPWQIRALLAEIRRITRPEGCVVIHTLPNRWALALAYPALRLLSPGLPRRPRSDYEAMVHVAEQSPRSLRRWLRQAGLVERVWVEEWTTRHAARAVGRDYPDRLRERGYPALARPWIRRLSRLLMATPARWWVANDLYALARPAAPGARPLPEHGRFRALR